MSKAISARKICQMSEDDLWKMDTPNVKGGGEILLSFDDGELLTTVRATIFSYYFWWPHREWPNTPMLIEHHIGNNRINSKTPAKTMEATIWCAYDHSPGIDTEYLALRVKQQMSHIYNVFTYQLEEYVTSISALDFIDVLDHPKIKAANDKIQSFNLDDRTVLSRMEQRITETHEIIADTLLGGDFIGNRLAEVVKTKVVDLNQVLQCVGPRGFLTDIDSNVFKRPIVKGFAQGLTSLYDFAIESRSGAQSLFLNKDPLADTEYFNRQMQLICETLSRIHPHDDCGSNELIPWTVDRANFESIVGMYYRADKKDVLTYVKEDDRHLIGSTIFLRTAMTCQHSDPYSVCGVCYGEVRLNIPPGANIGHVCAVLLGAKVAQKILSNKHYQSSALIDPIKISSDDAKYLRVFSNKYQMGLSASLSTYEINIIVNRDSVLNLSDINKVDDVKSLAPARITSMFEVTLELTNEDGILYVPLLIGTGSRRASFSHDMLTHVKRVGSGLDEHGNIKIAMAGWDFDLPVWQVARKQGSMLEFMGAIEKYVKSTGTNKSKIKLDLSDYDNVALALSEFYELVNQKFAFPLFPLAVILRSTMVRSKENRDYRLPLPDSTREFAGFNDIINYRSLSGYAAFQGQGKMFTDIGSFMIKDRPVHPHDSILLPDKK